MTYLKLAWRNMWRSQRRTLITVSSIFFAVLLSILLWAMLIGIFDNMIFNTVSNWCGYLQVHRSGYWEHKSVDSSFAADTLLYSLLDREKEISAWAPHLESFALASSGERTKGMLLMGIDPARENAVSRLSNELVAGRYLSDSDNSILLAAGLAEYLHLRLKDTVILLGQGYEGNLAAGKYPVKGIIRLGVPEMNKTMAWLPIAAGQNFLGTGPRLTSISVMVGHRDQVPLVKRALARVTAARGYEIMTWQEMNPGLDQLFQAKMAQNRIMSGVLYLVITFGIFGTILMMMNERMHEFGILIAIGMKKPILSWIVLLEMLMMSVVGTAAAIACGYLVVLHFRKHPIHMGGAWAKASEQFNYEPLIQPSLDISNFMLQGYVVTGITLLLSGYALYKIAKLKAIAAINS